MNPEAASWAGLAAGSPLVLVALCWSLVILHAHRPLWRAVDVFIAALLGQGCARQLLALGVALLQLLGAPQAARGVACSSAVWALTALHALHAATLASLVLDRALSLRWPRRYKRHPRRDHARYHVCVLTVIAGFVGLAAVFARPQPSPNETSCAFLPHELESRFALFASTLHVVLAVATLTGALVVEIRRRRRPSLLRSTSDLRALAQSDTSTASTASGRGRSSSDSSELGKPALIGGFESADGSALGVCKTYGSSLLLTGPYHSPTATAWMEPNNKNKLALPERLRWSTVVSVLGLCYSLHHLPLLVVIVVGSWDATLLPHWPLDSMALWAGLAQDCLLPVCLALCDANFAPWVARVYRRQGSRPTQEDKTSPSLYPGLLGDMKPGAGRLMDPLDGKFPLTNGSLFNGPGTVMNNYQRGRGIVRYSRAACMGLAAREIRGYLSHTGADTGTNITTTNPLSTATWEAPTKHQQQKQQQQQQMKQQQLKQQHSIGDLQPRQQQQQPRAPEPTPQFAPTSSHPTKHDSDSEDDGVDEEPIYATLSDDLGNLSSLGDELASRCCSVTTAANDDFVFHRGPQRDRATAYSSSSASLRPSSDDEMQRHEITIEPRRQRVRPRFYHSNCKILDSSSDEDEDDIRQIKDFTDDDEGNNNKGVRRHGECNVRPNNQRHRVSRNPSKCSNNKLMASSFSMNDLDRLDLGRSDRQDDGQDLEVVFELPVKSESILSLYRLHFGTEMSRGPADMNREEPMIKRKSSFNQRPSVQPQKFPRRIPARYMHHPQQHHHHHKSGHHELQARHSLGGVLSMDSLHSALARDVSYLDSGEICRHGTSFPDLQRVFVSDFI